MSRDGIDTDPPVPAPPNCPLQVQCVHVNPADNNLVITAGNDYTARVLDIRQLTSGGRWAGTGTA
jgi:hypothetical protein